MGLLNIVLFSVLFASGYAEIVGTSTCVETNTDICSIGEVRIDPCAGGKICNLRKKTNVSMSFDFTPNFATSNLETMVYWDHNGKEFSFPGFGSTDACTYTTCPTVAGQSQTLNYNLHVGSKLPQGLYPLKWKVWNENDENQTCCMKLSIRLVKGK